MGQVYFAQSLVVENAIILSQPQSVVTVEHPIRRSHNIGVVIRFVQQRDNIFV